MANPEHLKKLQEGVQVWNSWRKTRPKVMPDLRDADLSEADLREANLSEADLSVARLSGANLYRANLSRAILSGANLSKANLSEAILSGANLYRADLSGANLCYADLSYDDLSGAILSGANLGKANLSEANLSEADLSEANLSGADLRGAYLGRANLYTANLSGADLSKAVLFETKLREEDLDGAIYQPEQLADMIIEPSEKRVLIHTDKKSSITIRMKQSNPPVMHLIYLFAFIEKYYDMFYLFLFSQYESIDELQSTLSGDIYHRLQGKDEAVRIKRLSTDSPPIIIPEGLDPIVILISVFMVTQADLIKDVLSRALNVIFKTKKTKREEEKLRAELIKTNAEAVKAAREIGVPPVDLLPKGEKKKDLPSALLKDSPTGFGDLIDRNKDAIMSGPPRKDYLLLVLLLRKEGLLTNQLDDSGLANLLEVLSDHMARDYESRHKQTGGFDVESDQDDDEVDTDASILPPPSAHPH